MIDTPTPRILTIIPQSVIALIAEVSGTDIDIVGTLDIPYKSVSKIINGETIVTLDKVSKQILLHKIDGTYIKSITVPFGLAMNVKDSVIYIGGNAHNGEVCYMIDLDSDKWDLQKIELPVEERGNKAVDDIVILGNRMFLIDDIASPKYTFEYDITTPNDPIWIKTIDLPNSRTDEKIIKGDINDTWMAYLSKSFSGYIGESWHITLHGNASYPVAKPPSEAQQNFTLQSDRIIVFTVTEDSPFRYIDIALYGDRLFVLTDIGLGYYDFTKYEYSKQDICKMFDLELNEDGKFIEKNDRDDQDDDMFRISTAQSYESYIEFISDEISEDLRIVKHTTSADRLIRIDKSRVLLVGRHMSEMVDLEDYE